MIMSTQISALLDSTPSKVRKSQSGSPALLVCGLTPGITRRASYEGSVMKTAGTDSRWSMNAE
jgi:hypothetical protein